MCSYNPWNTKLSHRHFFQPISSVSLDEAKSGLGPNLMSLLTWYTWKIRNTKTLQQPLCKRQTVWTVHSATGCILECYYISVHSFTGTLGGTFRQTSSQLQRNSCHYTKNIPPPLSFLCVLLLMTINGTKWILFLNANGQTKLPNLPFSPSHVDTVY